MPIATYALTQQAIIRAGWIARSEGFNEEQNPHKQGTEDSMLWDIGWLMADDAMPTILKPTHP